MIQHQDQELNVNGPHCQSVFLNAIAVLRLKMYKNTCSHHRTSTSLTRDCPKDLSLKIFYLVSILNLIFLSRYKEEIHRKIQYYY